MIRDHHLFDTRYVYIYNIYTEISSFNPPTDTRIYYVYFENSNLKEYLDASIASSFYLSIHAHEILNTSDLILPCSSISFDSTYLVAFCRYY